MTSSNVNVYIAAARAAAKKYGVPEELLVRLLNQESKFDPNALSSAGAKGIAQFMPDTAKEYGLTDPYDPFASIIAAARYLRDRVLYFNGGSLPSEENWQNNPVWQWTIASYNAGQKGVDDAKNAASAISRSGFGAGISGGQLRANIGSFGGGAGPGGFSISGGESDWIKFLPAETQEYLREVTGNKALPVATGDLSSEANALRQSLGLPTTGPTSTSKYDYSKGPNIEDYYYTDENGVTKVLPEFWADRDTWIEFQTKYQALTLGPQLQFLNDSVEQIRLEIEAGKLDLSKASLLLDTRIQGYKTAMDVYSSKAFTQGAPAGAKYFPGREPGGYEELRHGLPPVPISGPSIDPLAEANASYQQALELTRGISTPSIPNISTQRKDIYSQYAENVAAPSPTSTQVAQETEEQRRARLKAELEDALERESTGY